MSLTTEIIGLFFQNFMAKYGADYLWLVTVNGDLRFLKGLVRQFSKE